MRSFKVRRYIAATPQQVWAVLTDINQLSNGDFGFFEIKGELSAGSKITLRDAISPKQAFSLTVTELVPNGRMVWSSGLPFGLFTGTRKFELVEVHDGTDFNMRQDFSGFLGRVIGRRTPDLQPSFEKFADALKAKAEAMT